MEDLRGILRVLCAEKRPCVYTSYAFEPSFSGNCASLCPEGMFSKENLYCVRDCGPGFYGNTQERNCQKCSSDCKTCLNGEENNLCSSCNSKLFLKGIVLHVTISLHLPPFRSFCYSLRIRPVAIYRIYCGHIVNMVFISRGLIGSRGSSAMETDKGRLSKFRIDLPGWSDFIILINSRILF